MDLARKIEELEAEISMVETEIECFELDNEDYREQYEEMLDECYEPLKLGQLTFNPSQVLKRCDPVAYRCGLNDYVDGLDLDDDPEYNDLVQRLEDLQDDLADLQEKQDEEDEDE